MDVKGVSMEAVLPHIGILPNQLWPMPTKDGHGERLFVDEPNLRILLEVFTGTAHSPLHIHTHADRFIYIAEGEVTFITPKSCTRLKAGQGTIIRANHSHGFSVSEEGAKLIHLSAGSGVQQSESRLPNHICQQFAPMREKLTKLQAFQYETRWKDLYSRCEVQTMHWVKQSMIRCMETNHPLPFDLETHKHERNIPMQAWETPMAFIIKVKGHSYGFSYHNEHGREFLKINRVFTLRFSMNRSSKKVQPLV